MSGLGAYDLRAVCTVTDYRPEHRGRIGVASLAVSLDPIAPAMLALGLGDDRPVRHIAVPPAAVPMLEEMIEAVMAIYESAPPG